VAVWRSGIALGWMKAFVGLSGGVTIMVWVDLSGGSGHYRHLSG